MVLAIIILPLERASGRKGGRVIRDAVRDLNRKLMWEENDRRKLEDRVAALERQVREIARERYD
jgi:hypothetical protein